MKLQRALHWGLVVIGQMLMVCGGALLVQPHPVAWAIGTIAILGGLTYSFGQGEVPR